MIDRVATVLELFRARRRLTLAQVARDSNLPRSSVHRILQRLVDYGWVERDGYGYVLGLRMFELGVQVARHDPVHRAAAPMLGDLHRVTGLSAHLSTLAGSDVVHLERVGADGPNYAPGSRMAAVHTAPGRALLASLEPEDRPQELPAPRSPRGIRTVAQRDRELARIREAGGMAVDAEMENPGITVVAVAIGPDGASARMAISVSGPSEQVRVERVGGVVRTVAMDVWHAANGIVRIPRRGPRPIGLPRADVAL